MVQEELAIWCPVIITSLDSPRTFRHMNRYQTPDKCRRIEDMKVRIKNVQSQARGKYVETRIAVSCLCLLEEESGRPASFKREEVLIDRVPLHEFDVHMEDQPELHYIQEIIDFCWDAELKDNTILIMYDLSYKLMGTKEQLVLLQSRLTPDRTFTNEEINAFQTVEKANPLTEENLKLRRQIHFYETNLSSLKRGIRKAEKDKTALSVELGAYKNMVEELQGIIDDKERLMGTYSKSLLQERESKKSWTGAESNKLGQRIKNLFISNS